MLESDGDISGKQSVQLNTYQAVTVLCMCVCVCAHVCVCLYVLCISSLHIVPPLVRLLLSLLSFLSWSTATLINHSSVWQARNLVINLSSS